MTRGYEIRTLDDMNNLELCMTWMTSGRELKALDAMNSSRLWIMSMIRGPVSLGL